jgi:hypothetical protein
VLFLGVAVNARYEALPRILRERMASNILSCGSCSSSSSFGSSSKSMKFIDACGKDGFVDST